jgi:hypothetical protein
MSGMSLSSAPAGAKFLRSLLHSFFRPRARNAASTSVIGFVSIKQRDERERGNMRHRRHRRTSKHREKRTPHTNANNPERERSSSSSSRAVHEREERREKMERERMCVCVCMCVAEERPVREIKSTRHNTPKSGCTCCFCHTFRLTLQKRICFEHRPNHLRESTRPRYTGQCALEPSADVGDQTVIGME